MKLILFGHIPHHEERREKVRKTQKMAKDQQIQQFLSD